MKEPGHLAGSYLATRILLRRTDLPPGLGWRYLLLGTLAGMLPDLDILAYVAWRRSTQIPEDFDHHRWISHTFPCYLVPGVTIYAYAKTTGKQRLALSTKLITASCVLHLLLDMIGSGTGLMWGWPLSRRMDGICTLGVKGKAWADAYSRHPISWIERSLILFAGLIFVWDLKSGHSIIRANRSSSW